VSGAATSSAPSPRRALITGASGDIGAAICRRLARAGHELIVHSHRASERAQALVEQMRARGARAEAVSFDITDAAAARAALEPLVAERPIQVLVNSAGIHEDAVLAGMSTGQWHRVIDVSLHGFFNVTQPLLLPMIRSRWGRIISLSSVAALIGNRGQVNYAAAKGALISATRALALEVATRGITVNAVAPGIIESTMTQPIFDAEAIARLVPMRRAGSAADVAAVVAFLVAESAGYITGQVLSVNGGMT
jgi:3-oxoacyl-[acyl-carrier protein] reductase